MVAIRYRRDRKGWQIDWREAGVRHRRLFSNRQVASEFRRMKEEALERRGAGLAYIEPISFSDYGQLFLENHFKEKSKEYLEIGYYKINRAFIPFFGNKLVSDIDQADIVAYRNYRREQGRSSKTIRSEMGMLYTMFKKAIHNGFAS